MAIQCKMCGSGMPDDAESCKVCGTSTSADAAAPVAAAPTTPIAAMIPGLDLYQTASPMSGGSGDMRVSLTGDVIEVPRPTPRGSGPGGYGPPPTPSTVPLKGKTGALGGGGKTGALPAGPAPARRYGVPAPAAEEEKSGGVPIWAFAIILVILAGIGVGAFMYMKKQAPVKVAQQLSTALVASDWNTVYDLMEFPEAQKALVTKEIFTSMMTARGGGAKVSDPKVGSATIDGETATVPLTLTVSLNGRTATETKDVSFKLINGQWKVDASKAALYGASLRGEGAAPGGQ